MTRGEFVSQIERENSNLLNTGIEGTQRHLVQSMNWVVRIVEWIKSISI